MHIIKPYETSVTIFHRDGGAWTYPTKKALLNELGMRWIMNNVGKHFREFRYAYQVLGVTGWRYEPVYSEHEYIMRDDDGKALTHGDFADIVERRKTYWGYRGRLLDNWNGEGPVPGVRRPRGGNYFRHPKTTNERRWATPVLEDGEPAPRAARNSHHLPNSWDDYQRASREDRNWKRFRKTRWKQAD